MDRTVFSPMIDCGLIFMFFCLFFFSLLSEPNFIQIVNEAPAPPPLDMDSELQRVMTPEPQEPSSSASNPPDAQGAENDEQNSAAEEQASDGPAQETPEARLSALETFVGQVVEVYTCSICMELAYEPVTSTQCLHVFCGGCLSRWMFRTSGSRTDCPKCRTPIKVYTLPLSRSFSP